MHRLLSLTATLTISPIVLAGGAYELIWADEFDNIFVNPDNWEFQLGDGSQYGLEGWGNNELQYYTSRPQNVSTHNGELLITAIRENYAGHQYTSSRIRTAGRFSFLYGRAEARIMLPIGQGLWPAFWMMPEHSVYGGWARSGEIDIMEASDDAERISGTIHFGGGWPQNRHTGGSITDPGSFGEEWHVYAVEWEPDQIRWYLDGQLFSTKTSDQWFSAGAPGDENAPFDQEFHLILNLAVGGNFTITPPPDAPFPKTMKVDYVRVYQEMQTPWGDGPAPLPGRIEAEDYDRGYQGQAYFDTDAANNGGQYRPLEGVDIEACSEGGFNMGWIEQGEWVEYSVLIPQAGTYSIDARVASQTTGGTFRLLFDGQDAGADLVVPGTGGWQNWTTVSAQADLPAGEMVMRWENTSDAAGEYNINYFDFGLIAPGCPVDLAEPFGTLDLADISAFASGFQSLDPVADLAEPFGVFDLSDISAFTSGFLAGCP